MPALKPFTPNFALSIDVKAASTNGQLRLSFLLRGSIGSIEFPHSSSPRRCDDLWKHTCFEAFVQPLGDDAYYEINVSPSGDWNVYSFDSYRAGMRPEARITKIQGFSFRQIGEEAWLECSIDIGALGLNASGFRLGLTAVIETTQEEKSYWSLHHPGEKPDFHDRKGFQLELAPALRN